MSECAICCDEALLGRVLEVDRDGRTAKAEVSGTVCRIALDLLDDVTTDDLVLVQQGFAIGRVTPDAKDHP